jgi:phosphatidylglycerophosphate synthase
MALTPHAHASASSGYTRVIMAGLSLHYMSYHPIYCTLLYSVSCLLDAVDGQAARALGQTSKFGAVLDMVTDRRVIFFRPMAYLINPS